MNSFVRFLTLLIVVSCLYVYPANSQSKDKMNWSLVKEEGKTTVFTRKNKLSKIKEVRIKTRMDVDLSLIHI